MLHRALPLLALVSLAACKHGDDSALPDDSAPPGDSTDDTQADDTGDTPVDADGDGWPSDVDCDDSDPDINPGATDEPCTGVAEDCTGTDGDLHVPADQASIQDALDAAEDGDWVCVAEGTWEPFAITRPVNLVGVAGAERTIIDGGGAAVLGTIRGTSEVQVRGFTFRNGLSDGIIAGLGISDSTDVTVEGCVFDGIDGADNIGGLRTDGGDGLLIAGCTFSECTGSGGAALAFYYGGDATVVESVFEGNEAPYGPAIVASGMDSLEVQGGSFTDNVAIVGGGAIASANTASVRVSGAELQDNSAGTEGGHLWFQDMGEVELDGVVFQGGAADTAGGAIWAEGFDALVLDGCTLQGQEAEGSAAIAAYGDGAGSLWLIATELSGLSNGTGPGIVTADQLEELALDDVQIEGSTSDTFAVVSATDTVTVEITDSSFVDNLAPSTSNSVYGALQVDSAQTLRVQSTWFENNHSGLQGGAISVMTAGTVVVDDSVLTGNSSDYVGGGAYFHNVTDLQISDSEITSNVAGHEGGGLKIDSSTVAITGSTIESNTPDNVRCDGSTGCTDS